MSADHSKIFWQLIKRYLNDSSNTHMGNDIQELVHACMHLCRGLILYMACCTLLAPLVMCMVIAIYVVAINNLQSLIQQLGARAAILLVQLHNIVPKCCNSDKYIRTVFNCSGEHLSFSDSLPNISIDSEVCQLLGTPDREVLWKVNDLLHNHAYIIVILRLLCLVEYHIPCSWFLL